MKTVHEGGGRDILLSLLYPRTEAEMTPAQREEFELAVREEEVYLASPESAEDGIVRESVGDVSVTYRTDSRIGVLCVSGQPVAPAASARLLRCGLLGRWV